LLEVAEQVVDPQQEQQEAELVQEVAGALLDVLVSLP